MLKRLLALIVPLVLVVGLVSGVSPAEANHHGEGFEQPGGWNAIFLDPAGQAMVHDCGPITWAFHPWGDPNFNAVVILVMTQIGNIIGGGRTFVQSSWDDADIRFQKYWSGPGNQSGYTATHHDGWRYTYNESWVNPVVPYSLWDNTLRHEAMHGLGGHHNNTPNSVLRIGYLYPDFGWPDMFSIQQLANEWRCFRP